jgi:hypothetical protein
MLCVCCLCQARCRPNRHHSPLFVPGVLVVPVVDQNCLTCIARPLTKGIVCWKPVYHIRSILSNVLMR